MKKSARVLLLLGLLVLTSTLMLTGCGKSDGDATEPSPEAVEETIYCPLDHEEMCIRDRSWRPLGDPLGLCWRCPHRIALGSGKRL